VSDPSDERPYPPATSWRFPPPPVSRIWLFAAILGSLVGLLAAGTALVFLGLNSERDVPGFIDDQRVVKVAKRECRLMTSTVEGMEAPGTPDQRMAALSDQNRAVTIMVDRIRAVSSDIRDGDQPVDGWLEDWEVLVQSREAWLDAQRNGSSAGFRVPRTTDGEPISERMDAAAEDVCKVPRVLLKPTLAGTTTI